tara:strand:+ start:2621 stop:3580 length:960 start_codon:yes stop_codon:yes gene_type:complete
MKKSTIYSVLIILFCITACDKIEPPYKNICLDELACNFNGLLPCVYAEEGLDCDSVMINNNKTILVEKFTGHKCSGCPDASRKLDELKEVYGDNIISVAIHPGNLTEFTGTDNNYPYDFTTEDGDLIGYKLGAVYLPLGSINRIDGNVNIFDGFEFEKTYAYPDWSEQIYNLLHDDSGNLLTKNLDIKISTIFDEATKQLDITTEIDVFTNLNENYKLAIIIIEDGIVSPQKDGNEVVENYEHNDIYRCSVNSTFGQNIGMLEVGIPFSTENTIILNTEQNDNWTDDWNNINNCSVIAYVYNTETYVIEHTEKQHIINE